MALQMDVYSPDLVLLDTLDEFDSVIWEEKAFDAGSFSAVVALSAKNAELLKPETDGREKIIWIEGETAGLAERTNKSVDDAGKQVLTVKGRLLTGILERRVLWGMYSLNGRATTLMQHLVRDCCISPTRGNAVLRRIPNLIIDTAYAGTGATIKKQKTGGTLLDALSEIGEANLIAFGVRFNPAVPRMEFWVRPCVDRSVGQSAREPVFYSSELDDVLASEYARDSSEYRSIALVAGEGEGAGRVLVSVDEDGNVTRDSSGLIPGRDYATKTYVNNSIQTAIYDSWGASY